MKKVVPLIVATLIVVLLVWFRAPAPRPLSTRAMRQDRIMETAKSWSEFPVVDVVPFAPVALRPQPYAWCSPREILSLRALNQGDFQLDRVDVFTGATLPVRALDAFFANHENRSEPFGWALSPDGQWFLGFTRQRSGGGTLLTCRLDGSASTQSVCSPDALAVSADGNCWVELEERPEQTRARVVSRTTRGAREVPLRSTRGLVPIGFDQRTGCLLCWERPDETRAISPIRCCRFDLGHPELRPSRFSLEVGPLACSMDQAEMNPQGERIAWLFAFNNRETLVDFIKRRLAGSPTVRHRMTGVWICNADGTGLREVARADANESVSDLRWLPDGKRVSVIYRDALWVLPVD